MTRTIAEIITDLSQEILPIHLKSKTKGGAKLTFITWYTATIYLDRYAPGWSYEVKQVSQIGQLCVVVARITIPCAEGVVYREGTGCEDDDHDGYGDPTSNAESMALKRAAAKFGLGRYLYDRDHIHKIPPMTATQATEAGRKSKVESAEPLELSTQNSELTTQNSPPPPRPMPPRAQSAADLVTPGQLISIRTLAKNANPPIDPEAECRKLFASDLCELSQHGGRQMIEHLKQQTGQAKGEPVKADATVFWSFVRRTPGVTDLMARTTLNKWTAEDGVTDWAAAIQAVKDQLTAKV